MATGLHQDMRQNLYESFSIERAAKLAGVSVQSLRRAASVGAAAPTGPDGRWTFADVRRVRAGVGAARSAGILGVPEGAADVIAHVVADDGTIRMPTSQRHREEAERCFAEADGIDERGDPASLSRTAELYERAIALVPDHARAMVHLGNVRLRLRGGDRKAARELYLRALRADPGLAPAHYNLGHMAIAEQRHDAAAAYFGAALRLDPTFADAHYHLAGVLETLGRRAQARVHWKRFLALDPESPYADHAEGQLRGEQHSEQHGDRGA